MTGFGRTMSRKPNQVELEVSIRAVNGRYLEIRLHLPREYAGMESDLKAVIGKRFSRGTLDVYVNRGKSDTIAAIAVNTELAKKWLEGYQKLGKALKLKAEPSLELLTRVPDVMKIEDRSEANDAEKKLLKKLVADAAEACDQERIREGKALTADLQGLCLNLEKLSESMFTMRAEANAELDKRLRDRLQKLGFKGLVDDHRIAQEVMMQLDRADISEELTRLREHVKAYRQLLKSDQPEGKKLDFYAKSFCGK